MNYNEITLLKSRLALATKRMSEMMSDLTNGFDLMNYFAKFDKFLPHSIIMPSVVTVGSQMPELDKSPPPPNIN